MKDYKEVANHVFERRERFETERKNKRKRIVGTLAPICCVCLVALLALGAWQVGIFDTKPEETLNDAVQPGIKDWYGPGEEPDSKANDNPGNGENEPSGNITVRAFDFNVNEITQKVKGAPLYRDPALYHNDYWSLKRTEDYFGFSIVSVLEGILNNHSISYVKKDEFKVVYDNTGNLAEDIVCYGFSGADGQKLDISASKLGTPYDCVYMSNTDEITEVYIPERKETVSLKIYAENRITEASEYSFYVIDFECGVVHYRITAENIAEDVLKSCILDILILSK